MRGFLINRVVECSDRDLYIKLFNLQVASMLNAAMFCFNVETPRSPLRHNCWTEANASLINRVPPTLNVSNLLNLNNPLFIRVFTSNLFTLCLLLPRNPCRLLPSPLPFSPSATQYVLREAIAPPLLSNLRYRLEAENGMPTRLLKLSRAHGLGHVELLAGTK